MKRRSRNDRIYLILKGIAMGTVNKVPGVSGGLVALIGGFYEEMIYTFQKFNFKALSFFFKGQWRAFYQYTNFQFLLWLILGIVISYFSTAILLDALLAHSEVDVWACFLGMILASLYYIRPQIQKWYPSTYSVLVIGLLLGLLVSFSNPIPENDHLLYVFICGIVSVCGMALPGLSGSYLLLLLGNYSLLLVDTVNQVGGMALGILQGNFEILENPTNQQSITILLVFVLGSLTGLVLFSNILSYLLRHYKSQTLSGILGFIIGAMRSVWPWKEKLYQRGSEGNIVLTTTGKPKIEAFETFWPQLNETSTWITLFFIIAGSGLVAALEWYGKTKTQR